MRRGGGGGRGSRRTCHTRVAAMVMAMAMAVEVVACAGRGERRCFQAAAAATCDRDEDGGENEEEERHGLSGRRQGRRHSGRIMRDLTGGSRFWTHRCPVDRPEQRGNHVRAVARGGGRAVHWTSLTPSQRAASTRQPWHL